MLQGKIFPGSFSHRQVVLGYRPTAILPACQSMKLLNHGRQGRLFHGLLNSILDLMVWAFQHFADILCHRALTALTGMNSNQGGDPFGLQSGIDLVERDLGRIGAQLGAAGPSWYRDEPRFFQRAENIADHNRIASGTFRQKIAGHLCNPLGLMNKYQAVDRNGAFHTDLHNRIQYPFQMI